MANWCRIFPARTLVQEALPETSFSFGAFLNYLPVKVVCGSKKTSELFLNCPVVIHLHIVSGKLLFKFVIEFFWILIKMLSPFSIFYIMLVVFILH